MNRDVTDGCKQSCGCWELSPHSLLQQSVPLRAEPSFQSLWVPLYLSFPLFHSPSSVLSRPSGQGAGKSLISFGPSDQSLWAAPSLCELSKEQCRIEYLPPATAKLRGHLGSELERSRKCSQSLSVHPCLLQFILEMFVSFHVQAFHLFV